MKLVESEHIELKRTVTERICKTVVAFANSSGGSLYIGIDDFGNIIGIDDFDNEMLRVSNMLDDSIEPSISELVEIEPVEHEGKSIIVIAVEAGNDRPYYLKSKGLVPAGVFTRLGPATVPVDRRGIRAMIRQTDGISFEGEHCNEQDLTFVYAQGTFKAHGIPFDEITLRNLGIIGRDGFYTNLGLLISDQNPYPLRCASFNDDALTEIINRIDCEGSIFRQAEEAEAFLTVANGLRSYFVPGKLERIDKLDYPTVAIREGVLNTIIHREYDMRADTLIKMSRTEIRFTNLGGLEGISVEDAIEGFTEARNPLLRQLFYRLNIVEALGTGLQRIVQQYRAEELTPAVKSTGNWFCLSLPNVNTTRNPYLSLKRNDGPNLRGEYQDYERLDDDGMLPPEVVRAFAPIRAAHEKALAKMGLFPNQTATEHQRRALEAATNEGAGPRLSWKPFDEDSMSAAQTILIEFASTRGDVFSRQEAEEALGTGRDGTLKVINDMIEDGTIVKEGKARATRYRVARA